jgi:hypothetical protein
MRRLAQKNNSHRKHYRDNHGQKSKKDRKGNGYPKCEGIIVSGEPELLILPNREPNRAAQYTTSNIPTEPARDGGKRYCYKELFHWSSHRRDATILHRNARQAKALYFGANVKRSQTLRT